MGIVVRETGMGQSHHHAPVRDLEADAKEAGSTAESQDHWKCLGVGCTATWSLPPGERPKA
jgi:hypothetical protein